MQPLFSKFLGLKELERKLKIWKINFCIANQVDNQIVYQLLGNNPARATQYDKIN